MRLRKAPLLLAAIVVAASAARASEPSPRILSPASGGTLLPGRVARIEFSGAPAGAEEWEAFVSVDGGRTYPLRATPHLPISETAFEWSVPALPPGPLRIKLRFGAAGKEREFLFDASFRLGEGGGGTLLVPGAEAIDAETAPGEEGTIAWVDRENGRSRLVVPTPPRGMASDRRWCADSPASVPAPKRRNDVRRPERSSVPLVLVRGSIVPSRSPGRTIASLSRRNV